MQLLLLTQAGSCDTTNPERQEGVKMKSISDMGVQLTYLFQNSSKLQRNCSRPRRAQESSRGLSFRSPGHQAHSCFSPLEQFTPSVLGKLFCSKNHHREQVTGAASWRPHPSVNLRSVQVHPGLHTCRPHSQPPPHQKKSTLLWRRRGSQGVFQAQGTQASPFPGTGFEPIPSFSHPT